MYIAIRSDKITVKRGEVKRAARRRREQFLYYVHTCQQVFDVFRREKAPTGLRAEPPRDRLDETLDVYISHEKRGKGCEKTTFGGCPPCLRQQTNASFVHAYNTWIALTPQGSNRLVETRFCILVGLVGPPIHVRAKNLAISNKARCIVFAPALHSFIRKVRHRSSRLCEGCEAACCVRFCEARGVHPPLEYTTPEKRPTWCPNIAVQLEGSGEMFV